MPKVTQFPQLCKGMEECGICAFVCPESLYSPSNEMNAAGYLPPLPPNEDKCSACGNCMIYCPDLAIVVEGGRGKRKG